MGVSRLSVHGSGAYFEWRGFPNSGDLARLDQDVSVLVEGVYGVSIHRLEFTRWDARTRVTNSYLFLEKPALVEPPWSR